jgi:hypothetical protein
MQIEHNGGLQKESIVFEPIYPRGRNYDPAARKLALAILLQAFRDIVSPRRYNWKKDEDWHTDAMEWFHGEKDHPGSFPWVCHHLNIEPSLIREWLARYNNGDRMQKKRMAQNLIRFQISSSV